MSKNCVSASNAEYPFVSNILQNAWHQRSEKLLLPESGAPCPPFSGCLGETTPYVTFRGPPSRQSRHVSYFCLEPRNLEPAPHHSFIMSAFIVPAPVDPSPPVYRHYVRTGRRRKWLRRRRSWRWRRSRPNWAWIWRRVPSWTSTFTWYLPTSL